MLPPPGLYGGIIGLNSHVPEVVDGTGHPVPGLDAVNLDARISAPFLVYVPDVKVAGGSIGPIGVFPGGEECGQLVSAFPYRCTLAMGDPYVELGWSRYFGQPHPSKYPDALPILEGLVIGLGIGAVVPVGKYEPQLRATNGPSLGNNIWDVAPSIAITYTTPPLFAEGTEVSGKLYWNNYGINPDTHYQAARLLDLDFAVSEHIGRFQVGIAGIYAFQTGPDRQLGVEVPPDGRRFEYLALGTVFNYDMPEYGAAMRVKCCRASTATHRPVANAGVRAGEEAVLDWVSDRQVNFPATRSAEQIWPQGRSAPPDARCRSYRRYARGACARW
jgi:hypothetical protein